MSSEQDEAAETTDDESTSRVVESLKSGAVGIGTVLFIAVFFPVLVMASGAVLVFLMWPAFLGAFIEYGYLPGTGIAGDEPISSLWYLATTAWLLLLVFGPVLARRYDAVPRIPWPGGASRGA